MRSSVPMTIRVGNARYEFNLSRKITIINDESASGKTTLIKRLVNARNLSLRITCDLECVPLISDLDWDIVIQRRNAAVFFIDEGFNPLFSDEFASVVNKSSAWFVIISRYPLPAISYSHKNIFRLVHSKVSGGDVYTLEPKYGEDVYRFTSTVDGIVTEDSRAGLEFFSVISKRIGLAAECSTSHGNGTLASVVEGIRNRLVIADGAAIGPYIQKLLYSCCNATCCLWLPESFEWFLLQGPLFRLRLDTQLLDPQSNIDNGEYASYERYFTAVIKAASAGTPAEYSKASLSRCYVESCCWCRKFCYLYDKSDRLDAYVSRFFELTGLSDECGYQNALEDKDGKLNLF